MSYKKQNFKDGQVLTAEMLNKMEDGIANAGGSGGGVLVVNFTLSEDMTSVTPDKNTEEITNALNSGVAIYAVVDIMGSKLSLNHNISTADDVYMFSGIMAVMGGVDINGYGLIVVDYVGDGWKFSMAQVAL